MSKPLGNQTVFVVRAPLKTDPRDNSKWRDWAVATKTLVKRCIIEPFPLAEKLNFEDNRDREFARSAVRIYMPKGTDVVSTDRVEWNGVDYQILGHPAHWYRFDGNEHHIAVIAQNREG